MVESIIQYKGLIISMIGFVGAVYGIVRVVKVRAGYVAILAWSSFLIMSIFYMAQELISLHFRELNKYVPYLKNLVIILFIVGIICCGIIAWRTGDERKRNQVKLGIIAWVIFALLILFLFYLNK